jgi:arylsulfatase A
METMRAEEVTLAEALRGAGYRTGLVGKWHLGEHYPYVPHAQGFDEFVGFRTGHWLEYFDPPLERNGKPMRGRGFITDYFTKEAISFVERNRERPFLLYLAYNAPHSPYQAPEELFDRFLKAGLPKEMAAVYAMVENIDDNIGRLRARIESLGLARDTIFIFLTDNGPNGRRFTSGLRAGKGAVYEGGIRAPFFIHWPGRFKAHKVDTMAAHIDLYPTLLDLCSVPRPAGPPIDGVSIRPLIEGRAAGWPDRMFFTHREAARDPSAMYPGAVRTERYSLINGKELYNLSADPGQENNIAAAHPDTVKRLRDEYESWYKAAAQECGFKRKPIPIGYAEENPVSLDAPQSFMTGELRFHNTNGYAHDWVANWVRAEDSVYWDIDVVRAGAYEVALRYACPASDVGSKIEVSAGGARATAAVKEATSMETLPNRNLVEGTHYIDLPWATLPVGRLNLPKGRTRLTVAALDKRSREVMQLKSAVLRAT